MARRIWENLGTFVLALILAILVWVVALNEENPIVDRTFGQPVAITLLNMPADMVVIGSVTNRTQVTIRAPDLVWQSLTAQQIVVTADLGQLGPGTHTVPLQAVVNAPTSRVTGLDPAVITIVLERQASRACPVQLEQTGTPALGYQAQPAQVTPGQVTLEGPESAVASVVSCVGRTSVEALKQDYTGQVSITPVGADGSAVSRVTLSPDKIQVKIPVAQKQGFRDVAVKVVITGQLASGYQVTNIAVTPRVLTLSSSNPALVEHLPGFVETLPLDISGANTDIVRRVGLKLPAGVEGAESVLVEVNVAAIEYSLTVQRELEARGLAPGLAAAPSPATVDVLILGPLPVLDNLTPADVRVVLDLQGLEPGTYQLTPQVLLLSDRLRAENVLPSQIEVVISRATPTPTGGTPTPTHTATVPTPTRTRVQPSAVPSRTPSPPATQGTATPAEPPTLTVTPTPSPR